MKRPYLQLLRYPLLLLLVLSAAAPLAARGFEITDSSGAEHRFSQPAARIISLYPAHTENLVEMGAADNLIGISTSDTYPESILEKKSFSYHDTLEKFIAADPDCILIRPMIARAKPDLIKKLRDYGITVVSLQPTSIFEMYEYWRTLGRIAGSRDGAEAMIAAFAKELDAIRKRLDSVPVASRPRVYFESIHARMRTFSPDSIAIFCLDSAGGVNVAADAVARRGTNIAGYSKERILAKGGKIDVFLAQSGRMNRVTVEEIENEPGFKAIKAVREGRIYLIDEHLVARPTTRLLQGITTIQSYLYPEQPQLVTSP
jgi:iron complex transport system substrate-binding protein